MLCLFLLFQIGRFLNRADVQADLGVNKTWESCTSLMHLLVSYWASEVSPTLGCSIEISRDIYIYIYIYVCMSVCLRLFMVNPYKKFICQNARAELRGPNTRMLKVSLGSLKQSADYNFRLES